MSVAGRQMPQNKPALQPPEATSSVAHRMTICHRKHLAIDRGEPENELFLRPMHDLRLVQKRNAFTPVKAASSLVDIQGPEQADQAE